MCRLILSYKMNGRFSTHCSTRQRKLPWEALYKIMLISQRTLDPFKTFTSMFTFYSPGICFDMLKHSSPGELSDSPDPPGGKVRLGKWCSLLHSESLPSIHVQIHRDTQETSQINYNSAFCFSFTTLNLSHLLKKFWKSGFFKIIESAGVSKLLLCSFTSLGLLKSDCLIPCNKSFV